MRPYLALYVTEGQSPVAGQVARLGELIDTAHERTSGADLPPGLVASFTISERGE